MRQLGLTGLAPAEAARFEAFWPGPNAAALEATVRAARGEGDQVVFLHGPEDSGKTHLLKAAWRSATERGTRAGYLPLDEALMLDPQLIEGWGALDLVCLDAVERIARYRAWERALFRLAEELRERGARLLAAARRPPDQLGLALPDLASRLAWGPVYALMSLDDAGLASLATHLAQARGLELPGPVAAFLVRRVERGPAGIAKAVERLDEAALAAQRRLTVPFVRETLFGGKTG
jgi:DnaA-homolog protein